jgi:Mitochondrial K+-H+ exchange-related
MNVYLVPANASRFALYCEAASASPADGPASGTSLWGRMVASFRRALAEGEADAQGSARARQEDRGRLRRFITRKLAEAVAEQRLLWHLRDEATATLVHPDTIDGTSALALARAEFAADFARHRRWLIIDGVITAVTGPVLFFVPGPNLVSWYFSFRAVGHYFAMQGARQGLRVTVFTPQASPHLSAVADALAAGAAVRGPRVAAAAAALGLERLAAFVERIADRAP